MQRRPWVDLDGGTLDQTIAATEAYPFGALWYQRLDGGPPEVVASTVTVIQWPNGPLMVRGNVEVRDARGELFDVGPRLTLCRCGHSKNHPFCDLSHHEVDFKNYPRVESEVRAAAQAPDKIADEPLS